MTFQSQPIVKVAIEPLTHRDLVKLEKGLQALYQVDPAVEIGVDASTGQHTMMCLGMLLFYCMYDTVLILNAYATLLRLLRRTSSGAMCENVEGEVCSM